ncbi:MAG: right-handed parallel beta-helix repeat-containing protein [Candidatus Nanoarchaeia archaeon]
MNKSVNTNRHIFLSRFLIVLLLAIFFASAASAQVYIDSCKQLSVAGTYVLNQSVASSAGAGQSCFEVKANHVTLDCAGNSITGINESSSRGIYSKYVNTTIRNCNINNFATGIYFDGADHGRIENTNVSTSKWWNHAGYAIYLVGGANYNTILNTRAISYNTGYGIYIYSGSNYNTISESHAESTLGDGIRIIGANFTNVEDVTASSVEGSAIYLLTSAHNSFNNVDSESDYGADFAVDFSSSSYCENDLTDVTGTDGKPILYYYNSPATVSGEDASVIILCNADGSDISDSQATKTGVHIYYTDDANIEDVIAISDADAGNGMSPNIYPGIKLISSHDNTLTDITASSMKGDGVLLDHSNNNVLTNVAGETNFSAGIDLEHSDGNVISGCTGYAIGMTVPISSGFGLLLEDSSDNTITGCTFTSNTADGVMIAFDSDNNILSNSVITGKTGAEPVSFAALTLMYGVHNSVFANNTINGLGGERAVALIAPWNQVEKYVSGNTFYGNVLLNADTLLYIEEDSDNNLFYWNKFFNDADMYINDLDGGNYYNVSMGGQEEGNIYDDVLDGTVDIKGDVLSGYWADSLYVGTEGAGYPYNSANSLGKVNIVDYAPLTQFPITSPENATLTVTKIVVNDDDGTMVVSDFPLYVGDVQVISGESNVFAAGTYTVYELGNSGYTGLISGDCASNGEITLNPGDVKSCTITNDDVEPSMATLTVIKAVVNDDGGNKTVSEFTLYIDELQVLSGNPNTLVPGTYVVSEIEDPGYAGSISGDCAADGSITLGAGDVKYCTITNNDIEQSSCTLVPSADLNGDGMIDNIEILAYIAKWKLGEVDNISMLQAIAFWKAGEGC